MKEAIKLSLVVPAYNEEARLPRTLDAIFAEIKRSRCPAEVIVVNNASTDKTRQTAENCPGVVVIDEPVKGLVRARSAGYHIATGDLIANIDADTIIPEGWLEKILRAFATNQELVAMSGPLIYCDLPRHTRALVRAFYCGGYVCYLLNRYVLRIGSMMQRGNFVAKGAVSRSGARGVAGHRSVRGGGRRCRKAIVRRRDRRIGTDRWHERSRPSPTV